MGGVRLDESSGSGKKRRTAVAAFSAALFLWAGVYLYVFLVIEPRLIYEGFGVISDYPVFSADWAFAVGKISQPAGVLGYATAFLSHGLRFAWLGTLLFTLGLVSLRAGLLTWSHCATGGRPVVMSYVPSVLLLAALGRYQWPLADCLALSVAVWCAGLYAALDTVRCWRRAVLFAVLLVGLYHAVGAASHVFVCMVVAGECGRGRGVRVLSLYLTAGIGLPWLLGTFVYDMTVTDGCLLALPFAPNPRVVETGILKAAHVSVPLVAVLSAVGTRIPNGISFLRLARTPAFRRPARAITVVAMIAAGAFLSFDGHVKSAHQMLFFSRYGMWDRMLELVQATPPERFGCYCNHELNKALYHKGRLGYDMFAYRQRMDALLLFRLDDHSAWKWSRVREYALAMGDLAFAEKMAFEVMENKGPSPTALKTLALVNAAKGQMDTARVFLSALAKDPLLGDYGKDMLARLERDPGLETCGDVVRLRDLMMTETDSLFPGMGEEAFLLGLVGSNRENRMAVEYLMAFYLLTRQIDKVAANVGRLADCGYTEIPTLYEEAVLLYQLTSRTRVDLHGLRIRPETMRRFQRYYRIASRCGRDTKTLRTLLAPGFGRSFFFYFHFFESGVGG